MATQHNYRKTSEIYYLQVQGFKSVASIQCSTLCYGEDNFAAVLDICNMAILLDQDIMVTYFNLDQPAGLLHMHTKKSYIGRSAKKCVSRAVLLTMKLQYEY